MWSGIYHCILKEYASHYPNNMKNTNISYLGQPNLSGMEGQEQMEKQEESGRSGALGSEVEARGTWISKESRFRY